MESENIGDRLDLLIDSAIVTTDWAHLCSYRTIMCLLVIFILKLYNDIY